MKRALPSDPEPSSVERSEQQARVDADTADAVREVVAAARDRKTEDLKVLRVGEVTHFTDYFLLLKVDGEWKIMDKIADPGASRQAKSE